MGYCKFAQYFSLFLVIFILALSFKCHADLASDRASLLDFMLGISSDPQGALDTWDSSNIHMCNWTGVTCNTDQDCVVNLDLRRRFLGGIISSSVGNLKSLSILDLSLNFFHGRIPAELGLLPELTQISLASNLLQGGIPPELGRLNQLNYLHLGSNKLVGQIPESIFCNLSTSLEYLDLSNNSLVGEIPLKDGCELRELRFLLLWSNHLTGYVPLGLANSTGLEWIYLESNSLRGELPSHILRQMPLLKFVYLSYNDFVSHDGNTNLKPCFSSLLNASRLQELGLKGNNLGGKIPSIIGNLPTSLEQIHLDDNLVYGSIPWEISNLFNLTLINLSTNLLNGSIPSEISRIKKLERLYLANNSLSGKIPPALGDIPRLVELGKMEMVLAIDLSMNNLSSTIPSQLGSCIALEFLNLLSNHLEGSLPATLGQLPYLQSLDVSINQLVGEIPDSFHSSLTLSLLNFSFNNFSGCVPNKGVFSMLDINSFLANSGLCGTIKGMNNCHGKRRFTHHFLLLSISLSAFGVTILCIFCHQVLLKLRKCRGKKSDVHNNEDIEAASKQEILRKDQPKYPRISHQQLIEATGGFNSSSTVGSGRFGRVYKGTLLDNTKIAMKVLNCHTEREVSGSFKRECRVLKNTRHRNLIKILTTCSKPGFKAIVFPLMSNGSLETSTDGLLCGSVGYIAPGKTASTQGDVYSFGVLLLEIVTRKRPTEVLFEEGSSLHELVKSHYPQNLGLIMETALSRAPSQRAIDDEKAVEWRNVVVELIELGLMCTQYAASTRPTMLDAAQGMQRLKRYISCP
ncbi:hypothetical protein Cgig2_015059 [Carnegiea gigantea]|uniref:Protein kinase domain-containing protein n=1 Tax=Carnegiea gigantea TaxID=171969 RepID=A0A9Q1K6K9_9CARY|nr:hypothetical protein Cgig2_015059 [Carnegiea gigantea]